MDVEDARSKILLSELLRRVRRRVQRPRMRWSVRAVSDADGPAANVRNYLGRKNLRAVLQIAGGGRVAGELGCGYGRVIMVLTEFYEEVHGFEREPHLLEIARALLPSVRFHQVTSLTVFAERWGGPFDLLMTNAVLQHIPDDETIAIIEQAKAHLGPRGHLLLAEKTDTADYAQVGDSAARWEFMSRGRALETWQRWVAPLRLKHARPIEAEPTYRSPANPDPRNVGTLMLFGR